jgi:hypothetical protein
MKKIALVNCFIGPFPWFFKFFLKSCETNPMIDFFIFTDNILDYEVPTNVKIIPFSLGTFNSLATQKLGFTIDVTKGYKLCDFKPAYGLLFSDYLHEYDFWGMTDIDVIYGRIREFMTDEVLDEYDLICVRHDFLTASCMLFRNNAYMNTLFQKSKDYEMVFTTSKNYAFDENNFECLGVNDKYDILKINCEVETMQHIILKEEDKGNLKSHFDLLICEGTAGKLKWDNGLFSYQGKLEIMLYHMLNYKGNIFANNTMIWDKVPDVFYFDKHNYRESNSISTLVKSFFNDHLKPFYWNLIIRIDQFLSTNLFKKRLKKLDEGDYFYYLSKVKFEIGKNVDESNYLKISDSINLQLYQMTFNKSCFVAKEMLSIFRLHKEVNGSHNKFDLIYSEGHKSTYIKSENSIINF